MVYVSSVKDNSNDSRANIMHQIYLMSHKSKYNCFFAIKIMIIKTVV